MSKYTVFANKEFETYYGAIFEEPVIDMDVDTPEQAEKAAKDLFDKGIYSSIYISFSHPEDAQCYFNPLRGHESSGVDWVSFLED